MDGCHFLGLLGMLYRKHHKRSPGTENLPIKGALNTRVLNTRVIAGTKPCRSLGHDFPLFSANQMKAASEEIRA